mgnify:FL=1
MRNKFLSDRTAQDIDRLISKILRDLGNPKPPLKLEEVRYLLSLDRQFYSSTDDGVLREFIHKLRLAGKQVIDRPSLLMDVVKKWSLKALYLPDRKRILIDASLPEAKWRWSEGHEINHSLIPWHNTLTLGDDKTTLTPACHDQIEAEANYGTGRLLFIRDVFDEMAGSTKPCFKSVQYLAKTFGNNLTNTLWRYVEQSEKLLLGVVCAHPRYLPHDFDLATPCRYYIRSQSFLAQFPNITEVDLFRIIKTYCSGSKRGPLGSSEALLSDANGVHHIFTFETFSNTHETLTLGIHRSDKPNIVSLA